MENTTMNGDFGSGDVASDNFLREFWGEMGVDYPGYDKAQSIYTGQITYTPIPEMQEIVRKLSANGIKVAAYTNVTPNLAGVVRETFTQMFPEVDPESVYCSSNPEIGRKGKNGEGFKKVVEKLGVEKPSGIVFIDDNGKYSYEARKAGLREITFKGDSEKGTSAVERFEENLIKAGLIS